MFTVFLLNQCSKLYDFCKTLEELIYACTISLPVASVEGRKAATLFSGFDMSAFSSDGATVAALILMVLAVLAVIVVVSSGFR